MSTLPFLARLRRFNVPVGMLLVLLQRTPVLRLAVPGAEFVLSSPFGQILKGAFGLAALGAVDSLAGATTFTLISATGTATGAPKSTFQVTGTVGTPINGAGGVTFSVSGAPGTPKSFGVTDNVNGTTYTGKLPPGLAVSPVTGTTAGGAPYYNTNLKLTINGTPTTAGSYTVRLWASDSTAIAGGNSAYAIATFTIAGGVSNVAPAFTTQPTGATVNVGSTATFTVAASGAPAPTFQWYHGATALSGQTGTSLTLNNVQAVDAGAYTANATNVAGTATSNVATLTVNTPATAPSITAQPQSVTVTAGAAANFSVTATGTAPLGYQWQKGGAAIGGATSATYSIASAQAADAGNYTVTVTNAAGSANSATATLTVNPNPVAPSISAQPQGATVTAGSAASFSVTASGTAPLSYQWQKGGGAIAGATSATYSIASAQAGDAGSYTVTVTNAAGSASSAAATLTVNPALVAPAIASQPQSVTVTPGSGVTFKVAATGTAPLSYQWQKGGAAIGGATSATYSIASAQAADAGNYTVVVTNSVSSVTSNVATLTVNAVAVAPSITTSPQSATVTAGTAVTLSVVANGTAPLTYQWQKGGAAIAGATNATFSIVSAQAGDAGSYTVVVTNNAGSATSTAAAVTVNPAPVAPAITSSPQSVSVTSGGAASFSVTATGAAPLSYQWQKNGAAIAGATSATYSIASAQAGDAGTYTVVVSNGAGSATSAGATLTVTAAPTAPSVTTPPQGATVTVGGAASLSVTAGGTAPLAYQWQKGGAAISGATSATFSIASVQLADAGVYTVVVSNSVGSATSAGATLTVTAAPPAGVAPVFTAQPISEAVATGHNVSLRGAATGTPSVNYAWQVSTDGGSSWSSLADSGTYAGTASSTLTITSATTAMNGYSYRLQATNSAGSATSSAVTLAVAAAPLPGPNGIVIDGSGRLFISDSSNNTIQVVTTSGVATVLAGSAGQQGATDGTGSAALFRQPGGLALDSAGNLYVADTGNSLIRKITPTGTVTTFAGSATNQGYRDGSGTAAWFNSPTALALDAAGNLYVADTGNSVIRKIDSTGLVTTLAGTAGTKGATDGTGAAARFNQPSGIAVDAAGNVFVADTFNQTIRRITAGGVVTTWVGLQGVSGVDDGVGANALFNQPTGLALDASGYFCVADTGNSAVRLISSNGTVVTLTGLAGIAGFKDGQGADAWFSQPKDLRWDSAGNIYVTDSGNAAIRKVTPAGVVTTMAITAAATATPSTPATSTPAPSTPATDTTTGKAGAGEIGPRFAALLLAAGAAYAIGRGRRRSIAPISPSRLNYRNCHPERSEGSTARLTD